MTRNKIEYDLPKSPYKVEHNGFIFYFSSNFYKEKFCEELDNTIENLSKSLSKRLSFDVDASTIGAFYLYRKVEKRGIFITYGDKQVKCLPA